VDCLVHAAQAAGVEMLANRGLEQAAHQVGGAFELVLTGGQKLQCERLMLATGGCRGPTSGLLATTLGHAIETPVPSLFTFHVETPWLQGLAGISVESVEVSVPGTRLRECGGLLITHTGLSGPAILRLSSWGARYFHGANYNFAFRVNWLPTRPRETIAAQLDSIRATQSARLVVNTPIPPLPARLWESLALAVGISRDTRWSGLSRSARHHLVEQLVASPFQAVGKSLNKEEFVTCGGVRLNEVDFKTMQSRRCAGLHFGGELLDIDGLTGGFNFQAAWTTGWIAGKSIAADLTR
jgi:predicted Rossmann fold flavoprotein